MLVSYVDYDMRIILNYYMCICHYLCMLRDKMVRTIHDPIIPVREIQGIKRIRSFMIIEIDSGSVEGMNEYRLQLKGHRKRTWTKEKEEGEITIRIH